MDTPVPPSRPPARGQRSCSFCGRQVDPGRLLTGLGACICDDCVARLAAEVRRGGSPRRPEEHPLSDAEVLARLPLIALTGAQVDLALVEAVALARRRRLSWAQVGAALGITRQAAWERFSRLVDTPGDRPTGPGGPGGPGGTGGTGAEMLLRG